LDYAAQILIFEGGVTVALGSALMLADFILSLEKFEGGASVKMV
jgi:hypothetical protein